MATSTSAQEILREYLIALGFKTDYGANRKFDGVIRKLDKSVLSLGKGVVGVTSAIVGMTAEFAYRMEKLYYSSQLAESAAGNLQALDFGGKQGAGIEHMTQNVMAMTRALRANPGLQGLLQSLGIKVQGRDKAEAYLDLIKALKGMPFQIAQQYAQLFGTSPDDLLLMEKGLDKIKEAMALRKQAAAEMGVDSEQASAAGRAMMQDWRDILMYVGLFKDKVAIEVLPAMESLAQQVEHVLKTWTKLMDTPTDEFVRDLKTGLGIDEDKDRGGVRLSGYAKARLAGKSEEEAQQADKVDKALPYHAPAGDKTGPRKWAEDYFRWREERGAVQRGEMPKPKEEPGPTPAQLEKEQHAPYTAPQDANFLQRWREDYSYWRENRSRAQRKLPPIAPPKEEERKPPGEGITLRDVMGAVSPLQKLGFMGWDALTKDKEKFQPPPAPGLPDDWRNDFKGKGTSPEQAPERPAYPSQEQAPERIKGTGSPAAEAFLSRLEQERDLPKGSLDRIWALESGRGKNMRSPKGAEGDFGFMPKTAREYGLKPGVDTFDFTKSAKAAADKFRGLLDRYHNDMRYAMAAYNLGEGNLERIMSSAKGLKMGTPEFDRYVLGRLPNETRNYISGVGPGGLGGAGVTINSDTKINVYETSNARDTGKEVLDGQRMVNADIVRNLTSRVQ